MSKAGGGQVFTPSSKEDVMREAELLVFRQMADNVATMTKELVAYREVMSEMRVDMGVIKERQEQHSEFKEFLKELKAELKDVTDKVEDYQDKMQGQIDQLKARNFKQDGAMDFATFLREFGPWILSMCAVGWAYFTTR